MKYKRNEWMQVALLNEKDEKKQSIRLRFRQI